MKKIVLAGLALLLMGCSSAELVHTWKNPDYVVFEAQKVLIVGMAPAEDARKMFETRMKRAFEKKGVEAVRSIDVFDIEFTNTPRTEDELDEVEQTLLDKDFDAILFTKVLGSENRTAFQRRMTDLDRYDTGFGEDYLRHQDIYYEPDYYEEYTVYHAETSLYCICVGKERSLIWRGAIDITDPVDVKSTVDDYVKLVVVALEEQDLIFHSVFEDDETSSRP